MTEEKKETAEKKQPATKSPAPERDYLWPIIIGAIVIFGVGILILGNNNTATGSVISDLQQTNDVIASAQLSDFIILTDNTKDLEIERVKTIIQEKLFFNTMPRIVDINSEEGQKLKQELGIKILPAYIFDKQIKEEVNFEKLQQAGALNEYANNYVLSPSVSVAFGDEAYYLEMPNDDMVYTFGLNMSNATVTIYEFSDFACPFCAVAVGNVKKILAAYPEVKVAFYAIPLHEQSQQATEAAFCAAESDKFLAYHNELFTHQEDFSKEALIKYAKSVGLNEDKFTTCLDSGKYTEKVQMLGQQATEYGIAGTPTFVVAGNKLPDYEVETFITAIEQELAAQ